MKNVKKCFE